MDQLFNSNKFSTLFSFKGGTSLSKVYHLINRFSEDIDLILDWRVLGYEIDEPWKERSNTQQNKFNKEANARTVEIIKGKFVPVFFEQLSSQLDEEVFLRTDNEQNVHISFPKCFNDYYILPEIRLEIGPLAAWPPSKKQEIQPYAASYFPKVFKHPKTLVPTISAERTFWEKTTILHQEAHRDISKTPPSRHSRHYYDLHVMPNSAIKESALNNRYLLDEVVSFKKRFYRCPWAR
ncbi:MAG: nucleotidyl transferase AbiEii/AbiGii toxin family protein [Bacilli bacterium]